MQSNTGRPRPHAMTGNYEFKAVALLALGFGIVGLDRFIINPLFPVMAKDLGLDYQDLGLISAALALCWGIASVFTGRLSDRIGQRKVIIPAVIIFSLLVAGSGLATGLISLLLLRSLMGFAEGAYVPASIVATIDASKPTRTGLNIGIQQMAAPFVGLGLGPILAVAMLKVLPSWHWVFGIVAIPGLILAFFLARVLRDETPSTPDPANTRPHAEPSWREAFQNRNVVFNTLGMFCWLSCLIVLSAFMPNYLVDHLKLSMDQMGITLAGLGVGSCFGMVILPALSDRLGRKPIILTALVIELFGLMALLGTGAEPIKLFTLLFVITFMNAGVVAITVGPLTSESVPSHLATTATGIVVGLGEIAGGAIAPALAGAIAQTMGISHILHIALGAIVLGLIVAIFGIREPQKKLELKAAI
jgi:MFS family permease